MKNIERHYMAWVDTGRDYIEFEFTSTHRAGSKANFEDAKRQYKRRHGHNVTIQQTYLM